MWKHVRDHVRNKTEAEASNEHAQLQLAKSNLFDAFVKTTRDLMGEDFDAVHSMGLVLADVVILEDKMSTNKVILD